MRHRKKTKKLGRTKSHRKATLRNIAQAIFEHHQIKTTLAKAKAARGPIERLITYGKKDTVASRRLAFKFLQNHQLVKVLFDEIAPTFAERSGGYTRVIKLGNRQGDNAELAILQLVGFEPLIIDEKKEAKRKAKKKAAPKKKEEKAKEAKPAVEEKKTPAEKAEPEKKEAKPKKTAKKKTENKKVAKEETPAPKEAESEVAEEKTEVKAKENKPAEPVEEVKEAEIPAEEPPKEEEPKSDAEAESTEKKE